MSIGAPSASAARRPRRDRPDARGRWRTYRPCPRRGWFAPALKLGDEADGQGGDLRLGPDHRRIAHLKVGTGACGREARAAADPAPGVIDQIDANGLVPAGELDPPASGRPRPRQRQRADTRPAAARARRRARRPPPRAAAAYVPRDRRHGRRPTVWRLAMGSCAAGSRAPCISTSSNPAASALPTALPKFDLPRVISASSMALGTCQPSCSSKAFGAIVGQAPLSLPSGWAPSQGRAVLGEGSEEIGRRRVGHRSSFIDQGSGRGAGMPATRRSASWRHRARISRAASRDEPGPAIGRPSRRRCATQRATTTEGPC